MTRQIFGAIFDGLHAAQAANAVMQTQERGGVIVFIGSVSGLRPSPGSAMYGAAKAAVISLASSLAVEWAPKVRVLAVSTGLVRTEQSHIHHGYEKGIAAVSATIPLDRMADPGRCRASLPVRCLPTRQLFERYQYFVARRR